MAALLSNVSLLCQFSVGLPSFTHNLIELLLVGHLVAILTTLDMVVITVLNRLMVLLNGHFLVGSALFLGRNQVWADVVEVVHFLALI